MKTLFTSLLIIGLVVVGVVYSRDYFSGDHQPHFRTTQVKRGDLLVTIGATGPLEPEEVVDVGAQVAGRIIKLGTDPRGESDPRFKDKDVDYGSPVHKGMLLAKIDPSIYQATHDSAAAALAHDTANLLELQAKKEQCEAEWERAKKLRELKFNNLAATLGSNSPDANVPIKGISDSDYITAKANYEVAAAYLEEGKATVQQDQATLTLARTNLNYTTINSPVEGTIIDRRVNIGQTVVASLNAPSLFLLARDLRQLQVWASVNEADIGRLKVGTPVRFTVDAYPEDEFRGEVFQIRLNATMTQNVVTYTVVVSTKNDDLKLLPYLTADVKFEVDRRDNVLLVPNGALRYQPQPQQIEPGAREKMIAAQKSGDKGHHKSNGAGKDAAGKKTDEDTIGKEATGEAPADKAPAAAVATAVPQNDKAKDDKANEDKPKDDKAADASVKVAEVNGDKGKDDKATDTNAKVADAKPADAKAADAKPKEVKPSKTRKKRDHRGQLWVLDGDFVRPIDVRVGATDGTNTEVSGPEVKEDLEIVTGEIRAERASDTTNPFAPKLFKGKVANPGAMQNKDQSSK